MFCQEPMSIFFYNIVLSSIKRGGEGESHRQEEKEGREEGGNLPAACPDGSSG